MNQSCISKKFGFIVCGDDACTKREVIATEKTVRKKKGRRSIRNFSLWQLGGDHSGGCLVVVSPPIPFNRGT